MTRRWFAQAAAAAVAGAVLDPELELYVPGKRVYSIPPMVRTAPTGFDVETFYGMNSEGFVCFGFKGKWKNPGTPDFKGVRIIHQSPGEDIVRVLAVESQGSETFKTDIWPLPANGEKPTIYAVPFDHTNRPEAIGLSTPKVVVDVTGDRLQAERVAAHWERQRNEQIRSMNYFRRPR